jgi:hypothetical protein
MAFSDRQVFAYDAWRIFITMRLHFSGGSTFNAVKYRFKTQRTNPGVFNQVQLSQKQFYDKIAKKYPTEAQLIKYYVSNFIGGRSWIMDFDSQMMPALDRALESFTYCLNRDLKGLLETHPDADSFDAYFSDMRKSPNVLEELRSGAISLTVATALDLILDFSPNLKRNLGDDPLALNATALETITQYRDFLRNFIDMKKVKLSAINTFTLCKF